jgi:hypothetical protein
MQWIKYLTISPVFCSDQTTQPQNSRKYLAEFCISRELIKKIKMFLNKTYCNIPASMSLTFPSQEVPKQIMLYNNFTDIQFLKHLHDNTETQGSSTSCACICLF